MKEREEPAPVIHLADRRPTPKELPAFALPETPVHEDPRADAFWSAMEVFFDGLQTLQAQLLTRLIPLALPELKRLPLLPLRELVCTPWDLPEELSRELEARLGSHPARVRRAKWLDARGCVLGRDDLVRGVDTARPGETGTILGRELYLLEDGRLGLIDVVGTWVWKMGLHHYDTVTTVGDARIIDAERAVKEFPLPSLVAGLYGILWFELHGASPGPRAAQEPELEARRDRFLALVKELSKATSAYNERLRRVGLGPA